MCDDRYGVTACSQPVCFDVVLGTNPAMLLPADTLARRWRCVWSSDFGVGHSRSDRERYELIRSRKAAAISSSRVVVPRRGINNSQLIDGNLILELKRSKFLGVD